MGLFFFFRSLINNYTIIQSHAELYDKVWASATLPSQRWIIAAACMCECVWNTRYSLDDISKLLITSNVDQLDNVNFSIAPKWMPAENRHDTRYHLIAGQFFFVWNLSDVFSC